MVFAGGGSRCLWQAGFWSVAAPALSLAPRSVSGVSAGAATACLILAGVAEPALERFQRAVARNPSNIHPLGLLRGESIFPHARMYRRAFLEAIDEAAFERLQKGPEIRVLLTRFPLEQSLWRGLLRAVACYVREQCGPERVHPREGRRAGFLPELISIRECPDREALADLILASSCTPPFTPLLRYGGRPVLDGGLVDNAPVEAVREARPTLVLLTRRHPPSEIPQRPDCTYVQPSEPPPIHKWDYTNAEGLRRAYDLGRRDAERFVQQHRVVAEAVTRDCAA